MPKTMNRSKLSEAMYQEVGLSRSESSDLLAMVLDEIATALSRDEIVKIATFGSFAVRKKGQRIGRNPRTGDQVPILPRRVLTFRPSQLLNGRVNAICSRVRSMRQSGTIREF